MITPRTIIIFSIFGAVLIVATTFIFVYRDQTDLLIDQYIAKVTSCGNITDEKTCYEKTFCRGVYGPSTPTSTDVVFKSCVRNTLDDDARNEKEKFLCQQTGGEWSVSEIGSVCMCDRAGAGKKFNHNLGCVNK